MRIPASFANLAAAIGLVLCLAAPAGAFAQPAIISATPAPPAASTPMPTEPASPDYVLGPEDVINVEVLGRADFKTQARIGADGTIQLPLIGRIPASERTARVLGEQVRAQLQAKGFFADPIVNVDVVSYASRYVTVLGSVGSPGLVPVNRAYRLSEILARVGGVGASAADYVILRPQNGPEKRLSIRDLATGDASQDPFVSPGDKIFSPVADVFYISGQVNSPGTFPISSGMTVRLAIARAGGLGPAGSERRVQVTRGGTKIKADLAAKVEPGDVIVVGERLF
jgi:polysaccharide export outer membrane protein